MNSSAVLYSKGRNDECWTPAYGVRPILKFIPKDAVAWCPFDTGQSEFVKQIGLTNQVTWSHLSYGEDEDFFKYEPADWDVMVSNPPFTGKRKIFERALSFGKPFALLMNLAWLNDAAPVQIWSEAGRELQLMLFDKRIEFLRPPMPIQPELIESPAIRTGKKQITFSSGYFCADFLPRQIVTESLR